METAGEDPQTRSLEVPAAALEFLNSSKESGVVTGRSLTRDGAEGPLSWQHPDDDELLLLLSAP